MAARRTPGADVRKPPREETAGSLLRKARWTAVSDREVDGAVRPIAMGGTGVAQAGANGLMAIATASQGAEQSRFAVIPGAIVNAKARSGCAVATELSCAIAHLRNL